MRCARATAWLGLMLVAPAFAHEVRPAYLELEEVAADEYRVTWKQPRLGDRRLSIDPVLPAACVDAGRRFVDATSGALIERWTVRCPDGALWSGDIAIRGLTRTLTDVLVRIVALDGEVISATLRPEAPSMPVTPAGVAVPAYLVLGIEHLLLGFDHILFVIGLMFLVRRFWPLVKTITAFTAAHSVTLALSTLGLVRLQQQPVEVVIALSILFLAVELARGANPASSIAVRKPWIVAFMFGLLHGFGFAGALADIGLPRDAAALALLLFNLGVEVGQLAVVGIVLGVLWLLRGVVTRWPVWVVRLPIVGMGTVSSYWAISRLVAL